jgi:hypothetical protein
MLDDARKDAIINEAVGGQGVRQIARRHQCSLAEVRATLDEFAPEQLKPSNRAAMLALEISRLETLEAVFLRHAIENMDAQAGTLVVKISQRKAAACGLDQPVMVRLDVQTVTEHEEGTSTERMLQAVRRLRAEADPTAKPDADEEPTAKPN